MLLILIFCFGAIIGSFLNVVILRLPQNQSLNGRSHCAKCGHTLGVLDLVPIFSFIFLDIGKGEDRQNFRGCAGAGRA